MSELQTIMDEFEHECFMLRVEASETRAKDDVVRKSYERIRDEFAGRVAAALVSDRESELQSALNKAAGNWAKADALLRERTSGTLTAEQVREAIFNGSSYASYDGVKYYADGIGMQAIADELNARLNTQADDYRQAAEYWQRMYEEAFAEQTCQNVDDHKTVWFICSVCGYPQKLSHTRSYCPNCGAKVVGE